MRKKVLLGCTLLLLVALIAGGTAAYLNQGEKATNVITMGKVTIELNDKMEDRKTDFPAEALTVMPGVSTPKNVWVTNTGADAWIRVKMTMTVTAQDGETLSDTFSHGDAKDVPICDFGIFEANGWIYEDGYWYYTAMVPAGGETKDLVTYAKFNEYLPNQYQGCNVKMDFDAQAVQYKNNEHNDDVRQVKEGWPKDSAETKSTNVVVEPTN